MANMTAHRASYFKNWPKVNEFWFISNGTAYFSQNAAGNNAANLKKQGKSDTVIHLTRDDYDAWVAGGGENGGAEGVTINIGSVVKEIHINAPTANTGGAAPEPNGGAAPEPNGGAEGGEPAKTGGAAPEPNGGDEGGEPAKTGGAAPEPNGGGAPEPTPRELAEKELSEALAEQGALAKNAKKEKKDAAAARVAAATAKVEELSK